MKEFDIILFGATSFVGKITAHYLFQHLLTQEFNANNDCPPTRFALAGRSRTKLEQLKQNILDEAKSHLKAQNLDKTTQRKTLEKASTDIAIIVADSRDESSLKAMVEKTKVMISTVGPYDIYGSKLIKVCTQLGVDYCDLTGETHWVKRMIDKYGATASLTGARIVNCCGFDSIPSDLGVHFLQQEAQKKYGTACTEVDMRVKVIKGGMSGGTVASIINVSKKAKEDARLKKSLMNPYDLCPANPKQEKNKQKHINKPVFESAYKSWSAPFIMEAVNTKVVHRSNALTDFSYTPEFSYNEAMFTGKNRKGQLMAYAVTASALGLIVGTAIKPSRQLLERFALPKPGEGPSKKAQENGFYDLLFFGKTDNGLSMTVQVTGDRDPGYGSTAKMLSQAALCLVHDVPESQKGGFWTPASIFGAKLLPRLQQYAGMTFKVIA